MTEVIVAGAPPRKATHIGELTIGELILPCAVLEDGTRVLSERGVMRALGRGRGGAISRRRRSTVVAGTPPLPLVISGKSLEPFIPDSLRLVASQPIVYRGRDGGKANGMEAILLPAICEVWLKARDAGVLSPTQKTIAAMADVLMRGLAHVGIIALIDEATGYQEIRSRRALEEILERYISKELLAWTKMFPDNFYREMFRLRGWQYTPFSVARPSYVGTLTNDTVYARLAPGVLDELRRVTPKDSRGHRKNRFHQWLTEDVGHPRLREHLEAVTALMRASTEWPGFHRLLQRAYPKINTNLEMEIGDGP